MTKQYCLQQHSTGIINLKDMERKVFQLTENGLTILLSLFSFFIFASVASFIRACYSRIIKAYHNGDDENIFARLSERSSCESCGTPLGILDLIPVFSCLVLLGRCRHCGEKFGYGHMAGELLFGIFGVLTAIFLYPLWNVSDEAAGILALISFACALGFLLLSGGTDLMTGFVWDFSSFWSMFFSVAFIALAGEKGHFFLFCTAGWLMYLVAMTGNTGYGDAAPISVVFSLAACCYAVSPLEAEAVSVYSLLCFIMAVSGIVHASALKLSEIKSRKEMEVFIKQEDIPAIAAESFRKEGECGDGVFLVTGCDRKDNGRPLSEASCSMSSSSDDCKNDNTDSRLRIPLVPHMLVALFTMFFIAMFTGGKSII